MQQAIYVVKIFEETTVESEVRGSFENWGEGPSKIRSSGLANITVLSWGKEWRDVS